MRITLPTQLKIRSIEDQSRYLHEAHCIKTLLIYFNTNYKQIKERKQKTNLS